MRARRASLANASRESLAIARRLVSRPHEVLSQKRLGQSLAVVSQHYGFRFGSGIVDPALLVEEIHQSPIEPLPDPSIVVTGQRQDGQGGFGDLVFVDPVGKMSG